PWGLPPPKSPRLLRTRHRSGKCHHLRPLPTFCRHKPRLQDSVEASNGRWRWHSSMSYHRLNTTHHSHLLDLRSHLRPTSSHRKPQTHALVVRTNGHWRPHQPRTRRLLKTRLHSFE